MYALCSYVCSFYLNASELSSFFFQAEAGIRDTSVTWSSDVCSSDLPPISASYCTPPASTRACWNRSGARSKAMGGELSAFACQGCPASPLGLRRHSASLDDQAGELFHHLV